jgi:hypothetical protein
MISRNCWIDAATSTIDPVGDFSLARLDDAKNIIVRGSAYLVRD